MRVISLTNISLKEMRLCDLDKAKESIFTYIFKPFPRMLANKFVVILLIDDDEDDRDFFKIALSDADINVNCQMASGATMAYEKLENSDFIPDFIFLDLNMPGINGRACLKQLKSNSKTAQIPVVIYSTSSEKHDINETQALGAVHFITKPTNLTQLTADLTNFFNQQFQSNIGHEK